MRFCGLYISRQHTIWSNRTMLYLPLVTSLYPHSLRRPTHPRVGLTLVSIVINWTFSLLITFIVDVVTITADLLPDMGRQRVIDTLRPTTASAVRGRAWTWRLKKEQFVSPSELSWLRTLGSRMYQLLQKVWNDLFSTCGMCRLWTHYGSDEFDLSAVFGGGMLKDMMSFWCSKKDTFNQRNSKKFSLQLV